MHDLEEDRVIFLHHIRRTGGRSLIFSVLGNFADNPMDLYDQLPHHPVPVNEDQLIWGWNNRPPSNLFFGWSHAPSYNCVLLPSAFTVTILRDPIERVLSHYRLLKYAIMEEADWGIPLEEKRWAEEGVEVFLDRIPRLHLLHQLYMFSASFNPAQAEERIRDLSFWFHLSDIERVFIELGNRLDLVLQPYHVEEGCGFTREQVEQQLSSSTHERLRTLLDPEYVMLRGLEQ